MESVEANGADKANAIKRFPAVQRCDPELVKAARGTPAEEKYRALARDATRALVDKELRPDAEEGRALKRVMSAPVRKSKF